jgi:hypothetical protein
METTHTAESKATALRRLLVIAKESGVRLLRDDAGEMWTTSASDPGWLHKVEPGSCSCRGFARAGRCRHQATLWSHLGYLDPDPDPEPACPSCHGAGQVTQHHSRWIGGSRLGFRDVWSTPVACPVCRGEEVAA